MVREFMSFSRIILFTRVLFPLLTLYQMEGRAKRGAFIVFEGIDRAGKSTQCVRLIETLGKSNQVIHMRFPERELASLTGPTIDQYLRGNKAVNDPHAIHLLFSTNRWELTDFLESFLVKGVSVICDRYAHSGAAYSMAKVLCPLMPLFLPPPSLCPHLTPLLLPFLKLPF